VPPRELTHPEYAAPPSLTGEARLVSSLGPASSRPNTTLGPTLPAFGEKESI